VFHEVTIISMHIYSKNGGSGVHYTLVTTKEAASCQNTADHQQRFAAVETLTLIFRSVYK